jgi:hypothetical protein
MRLQANGVNPYIYISCYSLWQSKLTASLWTISSVPLRKYNPSILVFWICPIQCWWGGISYRFRLLLIFGLWRMIGKVPDGVQLFLLFLALCFARIVYSAPRENLKIAVPSIYHWIQFWMPKHWINTLLPCIRWYTETSKLRSLPVNYLSISQQAYLFYRWSQVPHHLWWPTSGNLVVNHIPQWCSNRKIWHDQHTSATWSPRMFGW